MAISSLTCPPPVRRTERATPRDHEVMESAIELFDEGRHDESLARTFQHLFPDLEVPDLSAGEFVFAQGSSRVTVRVTDGHLNVVVPVVALTAESSTTAALRFVLSRIAATGQLYQPVLRGDEVYLEFSDRVTRLHPYKVREVLRGMPLEADANDDWMVAEFQCAPLGREPIEELTEEEMQRAYEIWQTHWDEVDELVKESQRRRSMFFLNELTAYAIHHIRQVLPLTGYWWTRISSASDVFNDTDYDPSAREASLAKCTKEMKVVTAEELRGSLGHATFAIPRNAEGTPQILANNLGEGDYIETIVRLHGGGRHIEAALGLIGTYNFMLARFSWSEEIEALLREGLQLSDGKSWRDVTAALLEHNEKVIEASSEDGDEDEDEDEDGDEDEDEDGDEDEDEDEDEEDQ